MPELRDVAVTFTSREITVISCILSCTEGDAFAGLPELHTAFAKLENARLVAQGEHPWKDLFPQGRTIYYEGDDPEAFAQQVKTEFGFDPSASPWWGERNDEGELDVNSYKFHCPAEHLDAIYGTDRWRMGS